MKLFSVLAVLLVVNGATYAQKSATFPLPPDKLYGKLFHDVQMAQVFPDGKTFVDCVPKRSVAAIRAAYALRRDTAGLREFVLQNFHLPAPPPQPPADRREPDVAKHIDALWPTLLRNPDKAQPGSSLLPLPKRYIVPGGRFREVYYWDSYFTMLGLKESGRVDIIEDMVDNFAYLIRTYGHIPNGNRTYYLSRSQPPFFALMVELLASVKGKSVYAKYRTALQGEYNYWMAGATSLKTPRASGRVVRLADGSYANRYWDDLQTPRPESYREDVLTAEEAANEKMSVIRFRDSATAGAFREQVIMHTYLNLRTGAASGWDFSSRWLADGQNLHTIEVTDILPVDLNTLMWQLEKTLMKAGGKTFPGIRRAPIDKLFWNEDLGFYTDYDFKKGEQKTAVTAAGLTPLFLLTTNEAPLEMRGTEVAEVVKSSLLAQGGLLSTPLNTGQQWDAPNGWAPLQWMGIVGLKRSGQTALADTIATRWIKLNRDVYTRTGRLMEKYNVVDTSLLGGGGEYPGQDGFGWTNGVLLTLMAQYEKETMPALKKPF